MLYNFKTGKAGIGVKYHTAKTIAAFLNSEGGLLYIGVNDHGEIVGLDKDYSLFSGNNRDKLKLEFDDLLRQFFNPFVSSYIQSDILNIEGKDIYVIRVLPSKIPVVIKQKDPTSHHINGEFYYRQEASSIRITDLAEIIRYIANHKNFNTN